MRKGFPAKTPKSTAPESEGTRRLHRREKDAVRAAGSYQQEIEELVAGEAMGEDSVVAALGDDAAADEPSLRRMPNS